MKNLEMQQTGLRCLWTIEDQGVREYSSSQLQLHQFLISR